MTRPIITVEDIRNAQPGSVVPIPPGALVTDLAQEVAQDRQIRLVESNSPAHEARASGEGPAVAIGSDHGASFAMKEALKSFVEELGYTVLDCGAFTPESVDYPDIAYAVARQVANGAAWRGIIIDGAGIGSCMAANKVPGIRAALCYNQAMAHNSREHNNANVLTLGAGMIGLNLARQIVATWLKIDFPEDPSGRGGRHVRRVNKIMEIEQRFLKG
jgi:ribose 5-phosphate isomerase B